MSFATVLPNWDYNFSKENTAGLSRPRRREALQAVLLWDLQHLQATSWCVLCSTAQNSEEILKIERNEMKPNKTNTVSENRLLVNKKKNKKNKIKRSYPTRER